MKAKATVQSVWRVFLGVVVVVWVLTNLRVLVGEFVSLQSLVAGDPRDPARDFAFETLLRANEWLTGLIVALFVGSAFVLEKLGHGSDEGATAESILVWCLFAFLVLALAAALLVFNQVYTMYSKQVIVYDSPAIRRIFHLELVNAFLATIALCSLAAGLIRKRSTS